MGILTNLIGSRFSRRKSESNSGEQSKYRCAQIKAGASGGCTAVAPLIGKRYLPDEIPVLPVPDCTSEDCDCQYELHDDRRESPRSDSDDEQSAANDD